MYNRVFRSCLSLSRKLSSGVSVGSRNKFSSPAFPEHINTCRILRNISRRRDYCTKTTEEPSESKENVNDSEVKETENERQKELDRMIESDAEMEKKFKILELEVDVLRQEGVRVPDVLKPQHWIQLLNMDSRTGRRKFLAFLWVNERKQENEKRKKEEAKKLRMEQLSEEKLPKGIPDLQQPAIYGLSRNTMFLRIYDTAINQWHNNRLIQAMKFGQKIVVDMGYDQHMTVRENHNCAKQLTYVFAENRNHDEPFDIYFCNANPSSPLVDRFKSYIPKLYEESFPINITSKSYLDMFDKSQLVYLTPHCRAEMESFDHDTVYIIGAMVDKMNNEPLSLAKAKKEGLRMAKFPLDKFLSWGCGSGKSLTLNQVLSILLDLRHTGDWDKALKHVPRRKLDNNQEKYIRPRSYAIETKKWINNSNSSYAPRRQPTEFSMEDRKRMFRKMSGK